MKKFTTDLATGVHSEHELSGNEVAAQQAEAAALSARSAVRQDKQRQAREKEQAIEKLLDDLLLERGLWPPNSG